MTKQIGLRASGSDMEPQPLENLFRQTGIQDLLAAVDQIRTNEDRYTTGRMLSLVLLQFLGLAGIILIITGSYIAVKNMDNLEMLTFLVESLLEILGEVMEVVKIIVVAMAAYYFGKHSLLLER